MKIVCPTSKNNWIVHNRKHWIVTLLSPVESHSWVYCKLTLKWWKQTKYHAISDWSIIKITHSLRFAEAEVITKGVTISFLSHVFFLVSIVRHPYFSFSPSYQETDRYLLAFPSYFSPLVCTSSLVSPCSTGLSHSLVTSLMVTMFPLPSIEFYNLPR